MNLGQRIREIRKSKKLTMKELGAVVGVSEQAIGQYERGLREPNLETLTRISIALEITIPELLGASRPAEPKIEYCEIADVFRGILLSDDLMLDNIPLQEYEYEILEMLLGRTIKALKELRETLKEDTLDKNNKINDILDSKN